MAEKKEVSILDVLFKMIFSIVLLLSVVNGNFLVGAKTIGSKMVSGTLTTMSALQLQGGSKK